MNKVEIKIGGRAWAQWLHVRGQYVKDCRIYEVNTDGPDGPREGFDE